jgi:hypothetical protein
MHAGIGGVRGGVGGMGQAGLDDRQARGPERRRIAGCAGDGVAPCATEEAVAATIVFAAFNPFHPLEAEHATRSPPDPRMRVCDRPRMEWVERNETKQGCWIDGQRAGTALPFPLWRLRSGPCSPPIDPYSGSGIPIPQPEHPNHEHSNKRLVPHRRRFSLHHALDRSVCDPFTTLK